MHNNSESNSVTHKINMSSTTGYKDDDSSPMIAHEVRESDNAERDREG